MANPLSDQPGRIAVTSATSPFLRVLRGCADPPPKVVDRLMGSLHVELEAMGLVSIPRTDPAAHGFGSMK